MLSIRNTGLLIVALTCAMPVCAQQVYQWKDEQGKTHYSDIPPPPEVEKEIQQIQTPPPAAPQTSGGSQQQNWAEWNLQYKERQEKAAEEKAQAQQQQQQDEQRERMCNQARNTLEMLTSGVRVARPDATGERSYMDDATRAAEIENTQRFLRANCS